MRKTLLAATALSLMVLIPAAVAAPSSALPTSPEEEAQAAAEAWLALLDAGDYEASWSEASMMFQGAVTAEAWAEQMGAVRAQVGEVESRELVVAEAVTDPPGAPAGEYVQLRYQSAFGSAGRLAEVVAAVYEEDRGWRVAGYIVQPSAN